MSWLGYQNTSYILVQVRVKIIGYHLSALPGLLLQTLTLEANTKSVLP